MTDKLYIRPAVEGVCDICPWPTSGLAARLVLEMRRRHGKGGVNVCRACLERARASLPPRPAEREGRS